MEKYIYLILSLSLSLVCFTGCKSNDEPSFSQDIVGKWLCTKYEYLDEDGNIDYGEDMVDSYGLVFNENGKGYECDSEDWTYEFGYSFDYSYDKNILQIIYQYGGDSDDVLGGMSEDGRFMENWQVKWINANEFSRVENFKDGTRDYQVFKRIE